MLGNFRLTKQMASSTERALLGLPLGEIRPFLQRRPKTWSIVTGLATFNKNGSTLMELQNTTHIDQVELAFADREGTTPEATILSSSSRSVGRAS